MESTAAAEAGLYDELAAVDVQWLRATATELRAKLRRKVAEVVASGKLLAAARRRLGRAHWRPWLTNEAGIPMRSACRLVADGKVFGAIADRTLLQFTPPPCTPSPNPASRSRSVSTRCSRPRTARR